MCKEGCAELFCSTMPEYKFTFAQNKEHTFTIYFRAIVGLGAFLFVFTRERRM